MTEPDALGLRVSPLTCLARPTPTTTLYATTTCKWATAPLPQLTLPARIHSEQPAQIIGNSSLGSNFKMCKLLCEAASCLIHFEKYAHTPT